MPHCDLSLLPPWHPVDDEERRQIAEVIDTVRPGNALAALRYSIVARTRFRDELIIRLEDGRFARVLMPDCYFPARPTDPLEVIFYDHVDRLNDLVAEDAASWGESVSATGR